MESVSNIYCSVYCFRLSLGGAFMNDRGCCMRTCCFNIVLAIVGALFAFGLGLLLGTVFAANLTDFVASIAVFVAVMAVLFVVLYILKICRRNRDDSCF